MGDRKMYRLSAGVEDQYLTEDSKVRIYLSEVRSEEKKRQPVLDKAITIGLELFYSFAVSYFVGTWAVDYAYKERGYFAIGSEYLLIGMTFAICFWAISNFLEGGRHGSNKERGRGFTWPRTNR